MKDQQWLLGEHGELRIYKQLSAVLVLMVYMLLSRNFHWIKFLRIAWQAV